MSGTESDHARLQSDYVHPIAYMEEIWMNILSKLPVKSVGSCKCVAKSWLRMMSESSFPLLQLTWSRKTLKYIICPYPQEHDIVTHLCVMEENGEISQEILLPWLESICSPEITCFLNGLICSVNEDCEELSEVDIQIFNPVTRDIIVLPRGSQSQVVPSVGIAFDPKSNDFKAFRFFSDSAGGEGVKYKCEVYTSGCTAWRKISDDVQRPERNPFHPFCPYYVSIAGVMYWFAWSVDNSRSLVRILSVDMNDNFNEIALPTILQHWSFLIELEGCLSVVHVNNPAIYGPCEDPQPYLEVHKLENGVWNSISKIMIDLDDIHSFNSVAARDNEIFFIIRFKDESLCYLIFDYIKKSFNRLDLDENFEGYYPVAFPFVESLFKCSERNGETSVWT